MKGKEVIEASRSKVYFGSELQKRRQDRGLSLRQLAIRINYSHGYLGKLERGQSVPHVDVAEHLDRELGVGADSPALAELAMEAAEGRSTGLRLTQPAQLPPIRGGGVGRVIELQALDDVLGLDRSGTAKVCLVHGPPGIGKTTLAVQWAHSVRKHFPDGQVFVDLRGWSGVEPRRPERVVPGVLGALGVPAALLHGELGDHVAMFRSLTAERRLLLVLDNACAAEQVLPLVPSSSGCLVVVTSRRRMAGLVRETGATRVEVGPLPVEDAIRLVSEEGTRHSATDRGAVARVVSSFGGVPLALHAVAEQLTQRPHQNWRERVDRLSVGGPASLLSSGCGGSELYEKVDWSVQDLPDSSRRLLMLLGLIPGVVALGAAASMLHWSEAVTRSAAETLVDEHLLSEPRPDHVELHPVIRAYASRLAGGELSWTEREAAELRWILWYLHSMAAAQRCWSPGRDTPELPECESTTRAFLPAFRSRADSRAWFQEQLPVARTAVERAYALQRDDLLWRIATCAAEGLASTPCWGVRLAIHRSSLAAARRANDPAGMAWALHCLGETRAQLRHWYEASQNLGEALQLRQTVGDDRGSAWTRVALAQLAMDMGRDGHGCDGFDQAHACFAELGVLAGAAVALVGRGAAKRLCGDVESARKDLLEAQRLFDELRDAGGAALALARLAEVSVVLGDRERALDDVDRALRLLEEDHREIAWVWQVRGHVLEACGDLAGAVDIWDRAANRFERNGDPRAADVRSRIAAIDTWPKW